MESTDVLDEGRTDDLLALRLKGNDEKARSGVLVSTNGQQPQNPL